MGGNANLLSLGEPDYNVLNLLPSAVYICDAPDGAIRCYNRRAAELWGCEPNCGESERRFYASFAFHIDGKAVDYERTPMAEILRKGTPACRHELAIERPDGSRVIVSASSEPLLSESGEIIGAIHLFEDVSHRKASEEAAYTLASIVESSEDAIISKDLDSVILSWNRGAERIYGYRAGEVIGRQMTILLPPDRPNEEADIVTRLKRGERIEHFETTRIRKDGQLIYVSLTISPIRERDGAIIGISHVARDITHRKRNDALLSRERRVLQQLAAGDPLESVLESVVGMVQYASGAELLASVMLLDADGIHLRRGPAPGLPDSYLKAIDGIAIGPAAGSCGTAAYLAATVISTDIGTDPRWLDYRDVALKHGLRACWSTPIFSSTGAVLGTLAIYSREARTPRPEELQIIELATRTAAIAIERRRGEEERLRLQERSTAILESITDAFAAVDADFRFTYINRAAEALLRRPRADLIGCSIWEKYPDLAGTDAEREYRRAMVERTQANFELFYAPRERWFEAAAYPAEDGGLSVYFRDVTERKRAEQTATQAAESLRNQQRWLEAVLDLLPTPMIFVEPGTARVTFANRAANEMAGGEYPQEKPAQEYHTVYFCTDEQGRRIPDDEMPGVRVARGERLRKFQMNWRTPQGDRALITSGDIVPPMYGHGAIGVLVSQDITELKRAEEALRRAQKLESLGVLAGGVAHDFNNLLTGIMGNASVVLEDLPHSDPSRPLLEEVVRASERAADLTRQLLAYSGKGRFVVENVDLSAQVRDIATLIQTSVPKTVHVDLALQDGLPGTPADAGQIQQIIMNLVINGAEAIGEGNHGRVLVKTGAQEVTASIQDTFSGEDLQPGKYVYLEVHDTGCGMDEETKARMFEPFFSTKFTGRGLGLSAVLGIVRGHKGLIQVFSNPGTGTTVRVLLPASDGAIVKPEPAPARSLRGSGIVLVVDDEPSVRSAARFALERYGYTVLLAANGREAVDLFRMQKEFVSLVLLDMTMPVMSGEETLRQLKLLRPEVPVILSSGYTQMEASRRFAGKGLSGFIQKPYTAAKLADALKTALESVQSI